MSAPRQRAADGDLPVRLIRLASVGSTNDYARSLLRTESLPEWTVVAAREQTAGRGQHGNSWTSSPGENLTCSVVLRPVFLRAPDQFRLAKAVCLALADALGGYGIEATIKWPNDVYVESRKIAGILIQNTISASRVNTAVVGIGLNVNQTEFPDFPVPPVSLRTLTSRVHHIEDVLAALLRHLRSRYDESRDNGAATDRAYLERLHRFGVWARYCVDGSRFSGRIVGVDAAGWLRVQGKDGEICTYRFKEIEYIS